MFLNYFNSPSNAQQRKMFLMLNKRTEELAFHNKNLLYVKGSVINEGLDCSRVLLLRRNWCGYEPAAVGVALSHSKVETICFTCRSPYSSSPINVNVSILPH